MAKACAYSCQHRLAVNSVNSVIDVWTARLHLIAVGYAGTLKKPDNYAI